MIGSKLYVPFLDIFRIPFILHKMLKWKKKALKAILLWIKWNLNDFENSNHWEKNFRVIGQGNKMITSKFSIPNHIVTQTGGVNEIWNWSSLEISALDVLLDSHN